MPSSIAPLQYPELAAELARRDLPHSALAEAVGIHRQTVSLILRGRCRPSADLKARIADYLRRPTADLFVPGGDQ